MKILFPLLLLWSVLSPAWAGAPGYPLQKVEDGDTLVIDLDGQPVRLQLLGIDAPEDVANPKLERDIKRTGLDQEALLHLGHEASNHLRSLIHTGDRVQIEGDLGKRDKYGRVPVVAFASDGRSLNATMIADGYAIVLGRYPLDVHRRQQYQQLETQAIKEQRGLWGSAHQAMRAWSGRR